MEMFVWQGGRTGGLRKSRPGEVRLVFGLVITMRTERGENKRPAPEGGMGRAGKG